jgi:hypothetical protein
VVELDRVVNAVAFLPSLASQETQKSGAKKEYKTSAETS